MSPGPRAMLINVVLLTTVNREIFVVNRYKIINKHVLISTRQLFQAQSIVDPWEVLLMAKGVRSK